MILENLENNAKVLLNHPEGNFNIDSQGNLYVIGQWNLLGRLIKYFFAESRKIGCFHTVSINQKIDDAVRETLEQIYTSNLNASQNKTDLFYITIYDDRWFDISGYKHTASAIGKKVKESQQFLNNQEIQKYANLIFDQLSLYPERELSIKLRGISEMPDDYLDRCEPSEKPLQGAFKIIGRKVARG